MNVAESSYFFLSVADLSRHQLGALFAQQIALLQGRTVRQCFAKVFAELRIFLVLLSFRQEEEGPHARPAVL